MKKRLAPLLILTAVLLLPLSVVSQGSFVYDQQSADESIQGGSAGVIQTLQPIQSFTPTLSAVGFIRLYLQDANPGNDLGATVYVNLRQDSITGPIIGTTDPVSMPDGFGFGTGNPGFPNFFFSSSVSVTPGTVYYFEPVVQSGDSWYVSAYNYGYTGGTAYFNGTANSFDDLWFREGIVVPEPSSAALLLVGLGAFAWYRRKQRGG